MSLRLQRKASLSMQAKPMRLQPRATRLASYGEDWLTKMYGTRPYDLNLWDILKGLMHGGVSYGLLAVAGAPTDPKSVAWKSFLIGGPIMGMEYLIDNVLLYYAYGTGPYGSEADINHIIHSLFQGVLVGGAVSAGFATLLASILK